MTAGEEIIEEIREARRRMSAECGHDPARLIAYLSGFNEKYAAEIRAFQESKQAQSSENRQEAEAVCS